MSQLFLNYWWIIIFLIIIVALIAKSLIKILITLIIFAVIFFIFWQIFLSSAFSESKKCFTLEAEKVNEDYQRNKEISSDLVRKQAVCQSDEKSYKRLTDCLSLSKINNNFGFIVYSNIPKFKKTITDIIESHNHLCPEFPLTYPSF
jgi:hypothetical protein